MKMPAAPTAALTNWLLLRVTTVGGANLHAGGMVLEHPHLKPGLPAITSPVSKVSDDRTWLATANRIYALCAEEDVLSESICIGLVSIIFENRHALPQRMEFLNRDGSIYLDVSKQQMAEWIKAERDQLRASIEELARTIRRQ